MNQAKEFFDRMLAFSHEAGDLALAMQNDVITGKAKTHTKNDTSIVTDADLAITRLFHDIFSDLKNDPNHVFIDEESIDECKRTPEFDEKVKQATYVWSMDPVDGTSPYAAGMPLWGVSLGLFKNGEPWLGVVYLPALKELFYHDGKKAMYVREAFTMQEQLIEINNEWPEMADKVIFQNPANYPRIEGNKYAFLSINTFAAVTSFPWIALKRFYGIVARRGQGCLWDIAGSWPIFKAAGAALYNESGKKIDGLDLSAFADNWKIDSDYIVTKEGSFEEVKNLFQIDK